MSGHRADRRQSPASIMDSFDVGQVVALPEETRAAMRALLEGQPDADMLAEMLGVEQ